MKRLGKIKLAREKISNAERELAALMYETFPVGTLVEYDHGYNTINCQVTEMMTSPSFSDQVHVRGGSGKEYWVTGSSIRLRGTHA